MNRLQNIFFIIALPFTLCNYLHHKIKIYTRLVVLTNLVECHVLRIPPYRCVTSLIFWLLILLWYWYHYCQPKWGKITHQEIWYYLIEHSQPVLVHNCVSSVLDIPGPIVKIFGERVRIGKGYNWCNLLTICVSKVKYLLNKNQYKYVIQKGTYTNLGLFTIQPSCEWNYF